MRIPHLLFDLLFPFPSRKKRGGKRRGGVVDASARGGRGWVGYNRKWLMRKVENKNQKTCNCATTIEERLIDYINQRIFNNNNM